MLVCCFSSIAISTQNQLNSGLSKKRTESSRWNPLVDIFENDNEVIVKAELPGMNAKDIEVKLENNVLMLKGERRFEKETKEENYHRVEREYGISAARSGSPQPLTGIR